MIDILLKNSWQFLLVACGIGIILYSVGKFAQYPFQFITDLVKIFIGEFDLKKEHSSLERMNAAMVILFFILSILSLIIECSPAALEQCIGNAKSKFPYISFTLILMLFISFIISPTWVRSLTNEKKIITKAREYLSQNKL